MELFKKLFMDYPNIEAPCLLQQCFCLYQEQSMIILDCSCLYTRMHFLCEIIYGPVEKNQHAKFS